MRPQSLRTTIPALLLMVTSCTTSKHVEFLGFKGCPNTPELRKRLVEAEPELKFKDVDLLLLKTDDSRLGWGAPTILVDNEDLFGIPPVKNGNVSCRNWSRGLPTVEEIREARRNLQ